MGKENLTPKQEKFCQKYIELGNASEAYRQSYDAANMKAATVNRRAKELLKNGPVTARIAELQVKHMKRHEVTVDSITRELEEARDLAMKVKQPAAAATAAMHKAKLHGLVVEKAEHKVSLNHEDALEQLVNLNDAAREGNTPPAA